MPLKKIFFAAVLSSFLFSCQEQLARKPISVKSGTYIKESIIVNKKIIKGEEGLIDVVMKKNPTIKYFGSKKGYWYSYDIRNEKDTLRPKKGDIVYFDYEIKDLDGNLIYSDVQLRPQIYKVDEQDILMGLRDGIKLMRNKEKVTFLFPSNFAYAARGDSKMIAPNMPISCTVTISEIKKTTKKEVQTKLISTQNE